MPLEQNEHILLEGEAEERPIADHRGGDVLIKAKKSEVDGLRSFFKSLSSMSFNPVPSHHMGHAVGNENEMPKIAGFVAEGEEAADSDASESVAVLVGDQKAYDKKHHSAVFAPRYLGLSPEAKERMSRVATAIAQSFSDQVASRVGSDSGDIARALMDGFVVELSDISSENDFGFALSKESSNPLFSGVQDMYMDRRREWMRRLVEEFARILPVINNKFSVQDASRLFLRFDKTDSDARRLTIFQSKAYSEG